MNSRRILFIMPSVSDAIGTFFEEKLLASLPCLQDYRDCDRAPDFKWETLWIEAKAAFRASDYGCIPKEYQFPQHAIFTPFVYAFGYHDYADAETHLKELKTRRGMVRRLHRDASIERICFISAEVVEQIWVRDLKTSEKDKIKYTRISASLIHRIIDDKTLTRKGVTYAARAYFGTEGCIYMPSDPVGCILTPADHELVAPLLEHINREELFGAPFSYR